MLLNFFIEKLAEEHYPEIKLKKCINFHGMPNGCSKCKDLCPEKAITFKPGKIMFDENICSRCGICKAICPTQAIILKGLGEENILRTIKDKDNIIFSCSKKNGVGTLKLSCLNGFHSELLAALFILFKDKKFYFNLSRCSNCQIINNSCIFLSSLNIAVDFVKLLEINPQYEIINDEADLRGLSNENISRRELFSLLKKESSYLAAQTADTIIGGKDNQVSMRRILLKSIEKIEGSQEKTEYDNLPFFAFWNVNDSCDGCGFCQSICLGGAWKVEKEEEKVSISHNSGKCYNCGICANLCSKRAIIKGNFSVDALKSYVIKYDKNLVVCSSCKKKFVPSNEEKKYCAICEKKEALRATISKI